MSSSLHSDVAAADRPDLQAENFLDPRLVALYRTATPEKKLARVDQLNRTLQALKAGQLQVERPELDEAQRRAELRRWWLSSRD